MASRVYLPMVRWYSPRQLVGTVVDVVQSILVTRIIDPRAIVPEAPAAAPYLGLPKDQLWFDFVADTGDGWNSTFSVARTLAREQLTVCDPAMKRHTLPRAHALVLGGDLVYPTPRNDNYETRLFGPFEEALDKAPDDPVVFAIPGNHDWYDGLTAFRSTFCIPDRRFAAWQTKQTRSHFAAALPRDWWLLGVDVQLGRRLDETQLDYFRSIGKDHMTEGSRVILVMPEPDWLELGQDQSGPTPSQQIGEALGRPAELRIAGNLHHYQRFETIPQKSDEQPEHRITAGGGGAFLHATHGALHRSLRNQLECRASFPPPEESKRYRKRVLAFPVLNPGFGLLPAVLYSLVALAGLPTAAPASLEAFAVAFAQGFTNPAGLGVLGLLLAATFWFKQRRSAASSFLALGHFAAQFVGVGLTAYGALLLTERLGASWTLPVALGLKNECVLGFNGAALDPCRVRCQEPVQPAHSAPCVDQPSGCP